MEITIIKSKIITKTRIHLERWINVFSNFKLFKRYNSNHSSFYYKTFYHNSGSSNYRNTLCHFPPSKKFLKKNFVRCHFPPEFKHIMFKYYVFCYIILIKLNKIFKIIFQKIFCWPSPFSPSQKSVKSSLFGGKWQRVLR